MRTILYLTAVGLALVPASVRGDEIHDAVRKGDVAKVKQLLAAAPDLANSREATVERLCPLHLAAADGDDDMVLFLLAHGARVDEMTEVGSTPLYWAVCNGHRRTAGLLLARGANVD